MTNQYGKEQIQVLEGLEAVRKRPGMYIGNTSSKGLHHLVWEIVDNCIDEFMAGYGDVINVIIHDDNSVTVEDHGRGIPVEMYSKWNKPTLEVVLTVLHAGGKFNATNSGYKTSGGLHGVGSSVTNGLSEKMLATVKRDGSIHQMTFEKGITTKPLTVIGSCRPEETGTTIWFKPDPLIFKETTEYDFTTIEDRLRESAMLNAGVVITLKDERDLDNETNEPRTSTFQFEDGLKGYISYINRNRTVLHDEPVGVTGQDGDISVEVAFQYTDEYSDYVYSYANNIKTPEGGVHETGFRTAISQAIKEYVDSKQLLKGEDPLTSEDTRVGLAGVISVKVPEPEFEGQTKTKLGNPGVRPVVHRAVYESLKRYLAENPKTGLSIVEKVVKSLNERVALKKARQAMREKNEKQKASSTLPEKLADCKRSTPVINRELYIVEGDSAGGSAKQGRDRTFQAILPLRGKVLNVERAAMEKILKNIEISGLVTAIGTGFGEEFDLDKRRYDKIILMTDADVDGAHIRVLLLTFFYRYMRPLIENGHIYIAQPPLYGVKKTANGKPFRFLQNDKELLEVQPLYPKATYQRYKGLGEMNPEDLYDTTMDPEKRTFIRATVEDVATLNVLFTDLMGDDPSSRKEFIEQNSHKANIDI